MLRLAFDIGSTFTDFALHDARDGSVHTHKVLTTPRDPSIAAMHGIHELLAMTGHTLADVADVRHATTLVANTLIERTGARVALLCTAGHRDVLDIRSEQRYDVYDLFLQFPAPLVPRQLRIPIDERIDRDGRVLRAPDLSTLPAIAEQLIKAKVEAVAIAFLHAYRNPQHEQAVATALSKLLGPDVPITRSSAVAPEIREYERSSTTVANAYVQPKVQRYLAGLQHALQQAGWRGDMQLTLSSGGSASAATAAQFPIRLVESGPAAGAMAAAHFGRSAGVSDLLAFDMGGTTAKLCIIENGAPSLARKLEVARVQRFMPGSGIPLQFPAIEMIEIGAGGGSIATRDALGLLKVGPRSAGSEPGPACYGLGGTQPTVTDANLLLGYLNPYNFAGGRITLHTAAAQRVLHSLQSDEDALTTAWGVHQLVNENMAAAATQHVIEQGHDPRRFSLLAYGGGGPLHGPAVAKIIGAPRVICPPAAGVGSAIGLLVAPLAFEVAQSHPVAWDHVALDVVNALLNQLEVQARAQLEAAGARDAVRITRSADGRFVGQWHDVGLALPAGLLDEATRVTVGAAFVARYRSLFGHVPVDARGTLPAIEFVSWRVSATAVAPPPRLNMGTTMDAMGPAHAQSRRAWFGPLGWRDARIVLRESMQPGEQVAGPAIIEARESTCVLQPGISAHVDAAFNLIITP